MEKSKNSTFVKRVVAFVLMLAISFSVVGLLKPPVTAEAGYGVPMYPVPIFPSDVLPDTVTKEAVTKA